jgi:signal transduction histidine kinase
LDADNKYLLDYLTESITGFLEVVSLYKKNELHVIGVEDVSIADEIRKLVDVFENLILIDKDILSCTLQKSGHDRAVNLYKKNNSPAKIFGGNFRTVNTELIESLEIVPRLILKEAIVNALEHCDEKNPSVTIDLEEEQNELLITIKNNGSATEEQFQQMRNPAEASSKLGWYFIHFFVEKILTNWNVKEIDFDDIKNVTWYTFQIKK